MQDSFSYAELRLINYRGQTTENITLIKYGEVAAQLGIQFDELSELVKQKKIEVIKIEGCKFVSKDEIERYRVEREHEENFGRRYWEQAFLASLYCTGNAKEEMKKYRGIREESFTYKKNFYLYRLLREIGTACEEEVKVDDGYGNILDVDKYFLQELEKIDHDILKLAGGKEYIVKTLNMIGSSAQIDYYAEKIMN
jgi:hypothetical protein